MPTPPSSPPIDADDTVVVTDIGLRANPKTPTTLDLTHISDASTQSTHNSKLSQLRIVDELFGPLQIGPYSVTRTSLDALGATLGGEYLNGKNTFFRQPKKSFFNQLQFSPAAVEAHMKSTTGAEDYLLPSLLFELSSTRPLNAPAMLREDSPAHTDLHGNRQALYKLLNAAQRLDIRDAQLPTQLPHWVNRVKSAGMTSMGMGLQSFGIYSGLMGLHDALRNKNGYETVFNGASLAGEFTSIAVEVSVAKKAEQMIRASRSAYKGFAQTRFGVRLGRSAGLLASALTLPFDIIAAVNAFEAAAKATGKEAIDHYVEAGLSVTSAAMTVLLGAAALAGFSAAGPVGLLAGLFLVAGARVWAAIRAVDDIDDYIELTAHERLRSGWFAVWGIAPDAAVQNRYDLAKATADHARMLQATARRLLDGALKEQIEAVVDGGFVAELNPVQIRFYNWSRETLEYATVNRPQIHDGNDNIDARDGVNERTPGASIGTVGEHKGVLWFIGGGDDEIRGVEQKPNVFHYKNGTKKLTGGNSDDQFVFKEAANHLKNDSAQSRLSALDGGPGNDTLVLANRIDQPDASRIGYHVDLNVGLMSVITLAPSRQQRELTPHTSLSSIENVTTLAGAIHNVTGTEESNIIQSWGHDDIDAAGGDDRIDVFGSHTTVAGGTGRDTYNIAHVAGHVSIIEDGAQDSIIGLDWRQDLIVSWTLDGSHLLIVSRFDLDDALTRIVKIKDVYKQQTRQRVLQNAKLLFITQDGFQLVPELPGILDTQGPINIQVTISKLGRYVDPVIVYGDEQTNPRKKFERYYIPRGERLTTLRVTAHSPKAVTMVYLDYNSQEMSGVEAYYTATIKRELAFDRIMYTECGLTIQFGQHEVAIKNLASSHSVGTIAINDRLTRPALALNQHIILVMNDGVSWRLEQPAMADRFFSSETFRSSTSKAWKTAVALPLKSQMSSDLFLQPPDNPGRQLRTGNACIGLTSFAKQRATEHLVGEGSTYLVHLTRHITLRISTPGALAGAPARLPYSSVWEFDATQFGAVQITLANHLLRIGEALVHLPQYSHPDDLVDRVHVITRGGIVHTVDIEFETIYVKSIDARYFDPEFDYVKALPGKFAQAGSLAVQNAVVREEDGFAQLAFDPRDRSWTTSGNPLTTFAFTELRALNRCEHQLDVCRDLLQLALQADPPIEAEKLVALKQHCISLL
ncbi:calcium-binding protein [Pseudomonas sp. NPDC098747]|uniref:calcium-binding protein n=1 Tax=Pseudomonas sp. NPDC098747 TaxID=3364487 RepID=UPI00383BCB28